MRVKKSKIAIKVIILLSCMQQTDLPDLFISELVSALIEYMKSMLESLSPTFTE